MTYPKRDKEPMTGIGAYHTGDGGWVAICWKGDYPHMVQVVGPFRTQTDATKWARKHYPRRYEVGRTWTPEGHDEP